MSISCLRRRATDNKERKSNRFYYYSYPHHTHTAGYECNIYVVLTGYTPPVVLISLVETECGEGRREEKHSVSPSG